MLTVLDVERLARMAEADNWLHSPQRRRAQRRSLRRAMWLYPCGLLLLAAALGVALWRVA